jgi:predicted metalloprotease
MRWNNRRRSTNVENRRGSSLGSKGVIGGGLGLIIFIVYTLLGGNLGDILNNPNIINSGSNPEYVETAKDKEMVDFISVVLADTEEVWTVIFEEMGYAYQKPIMVLFSDRVESACGVAGSSTGPFYCSADAKLYIDISFFDELKERYKAPGDFAIAYVVAHEVGHHVQTLLGITEQMNELRQKLSETEYNTYLVRYELQADYLAGVWANRVADLGYVEEGDIQEALNAASAVGDDKIQKQTQGYVVPDSFTHGTSKQRAYWFNQGYVTGNLDKWDTFSSNK